MTTHQIEINGKSQRVDAGSDSPLLYVLRDNLGLQGPKYCCAQSSPFGALTAACAGR